MHYNYWHTQKKLRNYTPVTRENNWLPFKSHNLEIKIISNEKSS